MVKTKKYYKGNPAVRFALWKAHNYREYYQGGELSFAELEVDHIIPESLANKPTQYKKYMNLMGLDEDFELNSIFNYVPTKQYINIRKSNKLLPPQVAAIALEDARRKAKEVEKIINYFNKDVKINKVITDIKTSLKGEKDMEFIYDKLIDDTEEFEHRKYVNTDDIFRPYKYSIKRINLDGFLPSFRDSEPSCMFLFRALSIRGCMITLDRAQIVEQLFKGIKTNPKYDLRGFISHPDKQGGYYIQLGNSRFILNKEETYELCSIVDDFMEEYIKSLVEVEEKLETTNFKKTKKGAYKLIKINVELWGQIVRFISSNDAYNTSGEWSIFDPNQYMIKVYTKNHEKYEDGYHVIIDLEREYHKFIGNYSTLDNEVWLVWKPHFMIHSSSDIDKISKNKNWTPQVAFKWLTEELIPKVIYENTVSFNFLGKPKPTYSEFLMSFDINSFAYTDFIYIINSEDILSKFSLLEAIKHMQNFFSVYETIFLKKEDINNMYSAVLKVLGNSKDIDLGYITGNLGFTKTNSYEKLIEDINNYINEIEYSVVGSFTIDTTLRCMVMGLRDSGCVLSTNEIQDICHLIKPLIGIYNREVLLKKDSNN